MIRSILTPPTHEQLCSADLATQALFDWMHDVPPTYPNDSTYMDVYNFWNEPFQAKKMEPLNDAGMNRIRLVLILLFLLGVLVTGLMILSL